MRKGCNPGAACHLKRQVLKSVKEKDEGGLHMDMQGCVTRSFGTFNTVKYALNTEYVYTVRTIYHAAKILFLGGAASSHPLKYINS
jgi:hypothetical protein